MNRDGGAIGSPDNRGVTDQILRGVYTPFAIHFGWPAFRSHFRVPTNASALVAKWCEPLLLLT